MTTVLSQKGQVVLPGTVRQKMHLHAGDDFEVSIEDEDTMGLRDRVFGRKGTFIKAAYALAIVVALIAWISAPLSSAWRPASRTTVRPHHPVTVHPRPPRSARPRLPRAPQLRRCKKVYRK